MLLQLQKPQPDRIFSNFGASKSNGRRKKYFFQKLGSKDCVSLILWNVRSGLQFIPKPVRPVIFDGCFWLLPILRHRCNFLKFQSQNLFLRFILRHFNQIRFHFISHSLNLFCLSFFHSCSQEDKAFFPIFSQKSLLQDKPFFSPDRRRCCQGFLFKNVTLSFSPLH